LSSSQAFPPNNTLPVPLGGSWARPPTLPLSFQFLPLSIWLSFPRSCFQARPQVKQSFISAGVRPVAALHRHPADSWCLLWMLVILSRERLLFFPPLPFSYLAGLSCCIVPSVSRYPRGFFLVFGCVEEPLSAETRAAVLPFLVLLQFVSPR